MSEEKKIIIDEDWKSQVEAEKEALAKEHKEPPSESAQGRPQLPPASIEMLITSLATEAMICLGQMPQFGSDKLEVNLDQARYAIDMLEVLSEKTKGNLSAEEEKALTDLLHQLRMAFVAVQQAPPPSQAASDAVTPEG